LTSHDHLLFTFTADRFAVYINERTTCICICYGALIIHYSTFNFIKKNNCVYFTQLTYILVNTIVEFVCV